MRLSMRANPSILHGRILLVMEQWEGYSGSQLSVLYADGNSVQHASAYASVVQDGPSDASPTEYRRVTITAGANDTDFRHKNVRSFRQSLNIFLKKLNAAGVCRILVGKSDGHLQLQYRGRRMRY